MLSIIVTGVTIGLLLTIAVFIKICGIYSYWNKKGVYTFKPSFPFGNCKDVVFQKIPLGFDITELYSYIKSKSQRFGGYYSFFTPVFIPVDLNLIKQILINHSDCFLDRSSYVDDQIDPLSANLIQLNGQRWRRIRSKILPSFSRNKLSLSYHLWMKKAFDLVLAIDEKTGKGEPFDAKEVLDRCIIDMIGSYVLGIKIDSMKNQKCDVKYQLSNFFNDSTIDTLIRFFSSSPQIIKLLKIRIFKKEMTNFFMGFINEIISSRKQTTNNSKVLLDILNQHENDESKKMNNTLKLTRNEIVANMTILLLAGYDTTSNTLAFCLYELSCNKKLQENLRAEINAMFDNYNHNPTYDAILELDLLDKCIYETLRKYPLCTIVTRLCTKQFNVPDSDLVIEEGCHVYIPIRGIHWDPEYYPKPEVFDPERFSKEAKNQRDNLTSIAFGVGPRHCIGFRFAMITMKLVIAVLLKHFEFSLNSKTKNPLVYDPKAFILQEKSGIWLNVKKIS